MKRVFIPIALMTVALSSNAQRYDSTDFRICKLVHVEHSMKLGGPGWRLTIVSGTDTVTMLRRNLSRKTKEEMETCFLLDRETFDKLKLQK